MQRHVTHHSSSSSRGMETRTSSRGMIRMLVVVEADIGISRRHREEAMAAVVVVTAGGIDRGEWVCVCLFVLL